VSFALSPDGREDVADLGRQEEAGFRVSRLRLRGDRGAAEVPVYECPGSTRAVGYRAARTLLSLKRKLTAILSSSDQLALGRPRGGRRARTVRARRPFGGVFR